MGSSVIALLFSISVKYATLGTARADFPSWSSSARAFVDISGHDELSFSSRNSWMVYSVFLNYLLILHLGALESPFGPSGAQLREIGLEHRFCMNVLFVYKRIGRP